MKSFDRMKEYIRKSYLQDEHSDDLLEDFLGDVESDIDEVEEALQDIEDYLRGAPRRVWYLQ
jgi:bacterioferritin (cytochrome b1)